MPNKLKPCPFCGGKAKIYYPPSDVLIQCEKCGATGPNGLSEDYTIEAWNRRAGKE